MRTAGLAFRGPGAPRHARVAAPRRGLSQALPTRAIRVPPTPNRLKSCAGAGDGKAVGAGEAGAGAGAVGAGAGAGAGGPLARLKAFFGGDKLDKERLKKLGLGAVASYGFVSNVTYGGGLAVAWVAFVKRYALSPLAAGQWPKFLAFYAGYWTLQNFVRPLRFSLALALAPAFDAFIGATQRRLGVSRGAAFGAYIALLGVATSVAVFGGIWLACGPAAYVR